MKQFVALCLCVLLLLSLCACSAYKSAYSATMLVRSEGGDHCETKFASLEGILVMKATAKGPETDGTIHYEAELGEGELSVYYDIDGVKELLFTIRGGERLDDRSGTVKKDDKVTFIIETIGTAKQGEIEIEFND